MNDIEVFQFPDTGAEIQTVEVDGALWFVAGPVARVLEYRDARDMLRTVDPDEKGTHSVRTPGGDQRVSIVSEPGLYRIITQRRAGVVKDPAVAARLQRFQRRLFHEVIPGEMRRRAEATAARQISDMPTHAQALRGWATEIEAREAVEAENAELRPKAIQADEWRSADGLQAVGDFANDVKRWAAQQDVKVIHQEVWDFLGRIGLLIRGNTIRHNQPTAFATDRDFVRAKKTTYTADDIERTSSSPRLTPAGAGWAWDRAVRHIQEHGHLRPAEPGDQLALPEDTTT